MNARSVYVKLRPAEVEALGRLALDQRRRPQDQAAYLLAEALKQADCTTQDQGGPARKAQDRAPLGAKPVEAGAT